MNLSRSKIHLYNSKIDESGNTGSGPVFLIKKKKWMVTGWEVEEYGPPGGE